MTIKPVPVITLSRIFFKYFLMVRDYFKRRSAVGSIEKKSSFFSPIADKWPFSYAKEHFQQVLMILVIFFKKENLKKKNCWWSNKITKCFKMGQVDY